MARPARSGVSPWGSTPFLRFLFLLVNSLLLFPSPSSSISPSHLQTPLTSSSPSSLLSLSERNALSSGSKDAGDDADDAGLEEMMEADEEAALSDLEEELSSRGLSGDALKAEVKKAFADFMATEEDKLEALGEKMEQGADPAAAAAAAARAAAPGSAAADAAGFAQLRRSRIMRPPGAVSALQQKETARETGVREEIKNMWASVKEEARQQRDAMHEKVKHIEEQMKGFFGQAGEAMHSTYSKTKQKLKKGLRRVGETLGIVDSDGRHDGGGAATEGEEGQMRFSDEDYEQMIEDEKRGGKDAGPHGHEGGGEGGPAAAAAADDDDQGADAVDTASTSDGADGSNGNAAAGAAGGGQGEGGGVSSNDTNGGNPQPPSPPSPSPSPSASGGGGAQKAGGKGGKAETDMEKARRLFFGGMKATGFTAQRAPAVAAAQVAATRSGGSVECNDECSNLKKAEEAAVRPGEEPLAVSASELNAKSESKAECSEGCEAKDKAAAAGEEAK